MFGKHLAGNKWFSVSWTWHAQLSIRSAVPRWQVAYWPHSIRKIIPPTFYKKRISFARSTTDFHWSLTPSALNCCSRYVNPRNKKSIFERVLSFLDDDSHALERKKRKKGEGIIPIPEKDIQGKGSRTRGGSDCRVARTPWFYCHGQ